MSQPPLRAQTVMRIGVKFLVVASMLFVNSCGRQNAAAGLTPTVAKAIVRKVAIQLTVPCRSVDANGQLDTSNLKLATVLAVNRVSGGRIRFVDDHVHPSAVAKSDNGNDVVTLNYEPEDPHAVYGQEFGQFVNVDTIGVRIEPVLRAAGMEVISGEPIKIRVRVNGVNILSGPVPYRGSTDTDGFKELDIHDKFVEAAKHYEEQVKSSS